MIIINTPLNKLNEKDSLLILLTAPKINAEIISIAIIIIDVKEFPISTPKEITLSLLSSTNEPRATANMIYEILKILFPIKTILVFAVNP
jgi:hypothetical protein